MKAIQTINFKIGDKIANGVINCIKRNKFAAVTVNVLNAHGEIVITKRMDGCPPKGIPEFSLAKANTCFLINMPSRTFRDVFTSSNDPKLFGSMTSCIDISGGNMAPFPGGIIV